MKFKGASNENLYATLAVFGMAAFRMMPSVHKILNAIHRLKFHQPCTETLKSEIERFSKLCSSFLFFNKS